MAEKQNLTIQRIDAFACAEGKTQAFLWDTNTPGLAVRALPSGNKSFIFQTLIKGGGNVRITIGDVKTWRLSEARESARQHKLLTDKGIDPRKVEAEKQVVAKAEQAAQSIEQAKRTLTARAAWNAYMTAPHPKWGDTHRQDHVNAASEGGTPAKIGGRDTKAGPLASLLAKSLHEITAEVMHDWLATESKTRSTYAQNSYRKFRAFIGWCAAHPEYSGVVRTDCCTANTVKDVVPRTKTKTEDSLQREQLKPWFAAVKGISNPVISTYLQALLLTGARRNEMAGLRWTDIDFQWNNMTIGDKVEESRTIPLTPYLNSLLQALPRENEWVFSSPSSKSGHIESPSKAYALALKKAALPHVSLHGMRRSFITLSEWIDAPAGVVAQISGHKPSAIAEKHYKRRAIDFLRDWHVRIEAWIIKQACIKWKQPK
jgi:integrase